MEVENNMYNCCENNNSTNRGCCLAVILAIVTGLFLIALSIILGAVFAEFFTSVLAPLVVLAIVFFIMAFVIFIYKYCVCRRND